MCEDKDIKIAGNRPSESVKEHAEAEKVAEEFGREKQNGNIDRARALGVEMAGELIRVGEEASFGADISGNFQLSLQRKILLAFSATVTFEKYCVSSVAARTAHSVFYNTLQDTLPDLYHELSDTSAFSFYYLAYRRGSEVERRIGQTFAMLCSHDGDPVYQELGEALYCWFTAVTEQKLRSLGLHKE